MNSSTSRRPNAACISDEEKPYYSDEEMTQQQQPTSNGILSSKQDLSPIVHSCLQEKCANFTSFTRRVYGNNEQAAIMHLNFLRGDANFLRLLGLESGDEFPHLDYVFCELQKRNKLINLLDELDREKQKVSELIQKFQLEKRQIQDYDLSVIALISEYAHLQYEYDNRGLDERLQNEYSKMPTSKKVAELKKEIERLKNPLKNQQMRQLSQSSTVQANFSPTANKQSLAHDGDQSARHQAVFNQSECNPIKRQQNNQLQTPLIAITANEKGTTQHRQMQKNNFIPLRQSEIDSEDTHDQQSSGMQRPQYYGGANESDNSSLQYKELSDTRQQGFLQISQNSNNSKPHNSFSKGQALGIDVIQQSYSLQQQPLIGDYEQRDGSQEEQLLQDNQMYVEEEEQQQQPIYKCIGEELREEEIHLLNSELEFFTKLYEEQLASLQEYTVKVEEYFNSIDNTNQSRISQMNARGLDLSQLSFAYLLERDAVLRNMLAMERMLQRQQPLSQIQ